MEKHTYSSTYPADVPVEAGIKKFFEAFYKISDTGTPEAHEVYADQFTPDATIVVASKRAVGREEILDLRRGMWAAVAERLHTPIKIFPFGAGANEVMIYGKVAYTLKDGRKADVEWAARALMVRGEPGKWKMGFYQVYLDPAAISNAK